MEENLVSTNENHMKGGDSKSGDDVTIECHSLTIGEHDAAIGASDFVLVKSENGFTSESDWSHIEVKEEYQGTLESSDHHTVKSKDCIKPETDAENDTATGVNDFTLVKTEDDFPSEWSHIETKAEHDDNMECSDHHTVKSKDFIKAATDDLTAEKRKSDGDEIPCLSSEIPDKLKKAVSVGDATEDFNKPEDIGASLPVSRRDQVTGLEKTYNCYACTYVSKFKSKLIIHTRSHTGEKPFPCNSCDFKCSAAGDLRRHMRTHTGERPYSCSSCEYRSRGAGDLTVHMRTHTGEKPFSCSSCDYICSSAGFLRSHMWTHTREKPFSCDFCDYRSSRAGDLRRHVRTHTGEKPFSCNSCNYRCSQAFSLKEHMRTHSGEKPFSCDSCEYRCCTAGSLKRHMRIHST